MRNNILFFVIFAPLIADLLCRCSNTPELNQDKKTSMVQIRIFEMNPFQENTYILFDETKECVIVDPGCYTDEEKEVLSNFIRENNLKPVKLLNTHCHIDHIFGNRFVKETYNIPFKACKADSILIEYSKSAANVYGFTPPECPEIDSYIYDNDIIEFGNSSLKAIHVPGHSPGSIVYYCENPGFILAGDVLFNGSIGRTDLPGGDYDQLISGIKNKLFNLGDEVVVYSGHGKPSTIYQERTKNPFFN